MGHKTLTCKSCDLITCGLCETPCKSCDMTHLSMNYRISGIECVSLFHSGVFFACQWNGNMEAWDLLDRSHEPALTQSISSFPLTSISTYCAVLYSTLLRILLTTMFYSFGKSQSFNVAFKTRYMVFKT